MPFGNRFLGLPLLGLALAACGGQDISHESTPESFSERRPKNVLVALIKLTEPPLLAGDQSPAAQQRRQQRIARQQDDFLKALYLLARDPDNQRKTVQVLYRYRMVLNGLTVAVPRELANGIERLPGVAKNDMSDSGFERPAPFQYPQDEDRAAGLPRSSSVDWLGATAVHRMVRNGVPLRGAGVSVGIIDTGIDYSHAMFGGPGTTEAFQGNDPRIIEPGSFPTAKVVGGLDIVGDNWLPTSAKPEERVPTPDPDPIDPAEGGHGTHVAGTVAGSGDGVNTHDGVAPDARLHAIKVFSRGGTRDYAVIAGLEYAADPNADGRPNDRLDVVNLSLGSGFGSTHTMYTEAFGNLVRGGTVAVCAAGNDGQSPFIVGAPSTVDACLSVAASVDDQPQNWRFPAIAFDGVAGLERTATFAEAAFSKPIAELAAGEGEGEVVSVGLLAQDPDSTLSTAMQGRVALARRGESSFADKARRAASAGAVALIVVNNEPGKLIRMSGENLSIGIPVVSITLEDGDRIAAALAAGQSVRADLSGVPQIEQPWLIDSIAAFSSQGPRSFDAEIKPEVSAPGSRIISAKAGSGREGVMMSGTSMASPHLAGLAALVRQAHPGATEAEIRSMIINTAKDIGHRKDETYTGSCTNLNTPACEPYPVSITGAGRARALEAVNGGLSFSPATLSLGILRAEELRGRLRTLTVRNHSASARTFTVSVRTADSVSVQNPRTIRVPANGHATIPFHFTLLARQADAPVDEIDGVIRLSEAGQTVAQIPFLTELVRFARVQARRSGSDIVLGNDGTHAGTAHPFNFLGQDAPLPENIFDPRHASPCNFESAGYRLTTRDDDDNDETPPRNLVQFAFKLARPVTNWQNCEPSVLIDIDGDKKPDRELHAVYSDEFRIFLSKLVDFQANLAATSEEEESRALLDAQTAEMNDFSTLSVLSTDIGKLGATGDTIQVRMAVQSYLDNVNEYDDFLGKKEGDWLTINLARPGYPQLPEQLSVRPGEQVRLPLAGSGKLVLYFPRNFGKPGLLGFLDSQVKVF